MSAVFGIWQLDGLPVDLSHIRLMMDRLRPYGRRAQRIHADGSLALGCCLDGLSRHTQAEQAVFVDREADRVIAADALVYNRESLLRELHPAGGRNPSDPELILGAYRKWGKNCPRHINGDFAFVLWEKASQRLILARDHLGVRPLFFFHRPAVFVFASDLDAILALPYVPKTPDEGKLYAVLCNEIVLDPVHTGFAQVKKLEQAHILEVAGGQLTKYRYWSFCAKKGKDKTEEQYSQEVFEIVRDAVRIRLEAIGDGAGAQLSGGLDSSVVVALANRELQKINYRMPLFSWSPDFEAVAMLERDERRLVELPCRQEGLSCRYFDPFLPGEEGPLYPLEQEQRWMVRQGVRYVLSGWGGDQGISHRANLYELWVNGYFSAFLQEAAAAAGGSPLKFLRVLLGSTVFSSVRRRNFTGDLPRNHWDVVRKPGVKAMKKSHPKKRLYFNIDLRKHIESGNIQTRTELSAQKGAESDIRYVFPLLDFRVVDLAVSMPTPIFLKRGINRYVYRKAFAGILPKEICDYAHKDDPARMEFGEKSADAECEALAQRMGKLDRGLFSAYLNFSEVEKALRSKDPNRRGNLRRILGYCWDLQEAIERSRSARIP